MGEFRERGAGALRQGWERMDERAADGRERVREAGVDQRGVGYSYGKNSSPFLGCQWVSATRHMANGSQFRM